MRQWLGYKLPHANHASFFVCIEQEPTIWAKAQELRTEGISRQVVQQSIRVEVPQANVVVVADR
ncbi:hypothetical protein H6F89_04670 [Cyanobacteria bacterium FACHB-63]|nr:hypothetical protein [Cyanobacteria bacterium FACHB-63]